MLRAIWYGIPLLFSRSYWRNGFSLSRFAKALFAAAGALWALQVIWELFTESLQDSLRPYWWIAAAFPIVYAVREVWPSRRVECRLNGRDITIAVEVGDLFATAEVLIVGSNRTFDTDTASGLISSASVQGQFTHKYYDAVAHLDADLTQALRDVPYVEDARKPIGKKRVYPVGATAKVRAKGRTAYFVAVATLNHSGTASGTIEDVRNALAGLWQYVAERGGDISPVRMPVVGTGFTRVVEKRVQIIREIVQSFVAACSQRRFCEGLTIVISPRDYRHHDINLNEIESFLQHVCRYVEFRQPGDVGRGSPV